LREGPPLPFDTLKVLQPPKDVGGHFLGRLCVVGENGGRWLASLLKNGWWSLTLFRKKVAWGLLTRLLKKIYDKEAQDCEGCEAGNPKDPTKRGFSLLNRTVCALVVTHGGGLASLSHLLLDVYGLRSGSLVRNVGLRRLWLWNALVGTKVVATIRAE
jgi:hypothetical protein